MARMLINDIPDEWVEEADQRNLSLGEYGRRMIRAGQRQFGHDYEPSETPATPKTLKLHESTGSEVETQLKAWIHQNLSTDDAQDVDDLIELLENDFNGLLSDLMNEGKAQYEPKEEGYLKVTDE